MSFAVFLHVYYPDQIERLFACARNLEKEVGEPVRVYVTHPPEAGETGEQARLLWDEDWLTVVPTPNYGKDIAPFFRCLQLLVPDFLAGREIPEFGLKLHTKRSSHGVGMPAGFGDVWRDALLYGLGDASSINAHLKALSRPNIGASGVRPFLVEGEQNHNAGHLQFYSDELSIHPEARDGFYAGSMFYFRVRPYLVQLHGFLQELQRRLATEPRDIMDTYGPTHTHTCERLLGWLLRNHGYCLTTAVDVSDIVLQKYPDEAEHPPWLKSALHRREVPPPQPFFRHELV